MEKAIHHCKQQPLVPLLTLATTGACALAAVNVKSGNRQGAQKWFRWRVGFQAGTLVALVVGGYFYGKNSQAQIQSREEQAREKAKQREKLWIEELERRDQETKDRKLRAEMARQKAAEAEAETKKLEQQLKELEAQLKSK